jgi:hypothetical protein
MALYPSGNLIYIDIRDMMIHDDFRYARLRISKEV